MRAEPGIERAAVGEKWRRRRREDGRCVGELARNYFDARGPVPPTGFDLAEFSATGIALYVEIGDGRARSQKAAAEVPVFVTGIEKQAQFSGGLVEERKFQIGGDAALLVIPSRQGIKVDGFAANSIPRGENRFVGHAAKEREETVERVGAPTAAFAEFEGCLVGVVLSRDQFGAPPRKNTETIQQGIGLQERISREFGRGSEGDGAVQESFAGFCYWDHLDPGQRGLLHAIPVLQSGLGVSFKQINRAEEFEQDRKSACRERV